MLKEGAYKVIQRKYVYKSVFKYIFLIGKRASTRRIGITKKKVKERTETRVEEEDDRDKVDLDDVPLFNRGDMLSDVEEQDLEEEVLPKKRRGRKPKKLQPPTTTSPSVTSMLNFCFILFFCINMDVTMLP